ncbi:acyltransferase [Candidatus Methylospira mobilis]|uniref:acyltransferase family protein n=1 Tax=Candidatus Methylospira mobilis TaxID=1808979 RepID=UPI0028E5D01D|nr:acyltransferase [Candidatus Methylospira mobilis]WNV05398.1 acyltransferase [Candidatus Methylospira mobilis]
MPLAVPLISLISFLVFSLVKYDIFDHFGGISYGNVLLYHAFRLIMLGIFATSFFYRSEAFAAFLSAQPLKTASCIDPYNAVRRQFDPLLGLRAAAFLMVFLGHWFMVVFPPVDLLQPDGNLMVRSLVSASPWGGVWVFFTLSGYLMGKGFVTERYSFTQASIVVFYRNRALRVIPLYLLSIFLIVVLQKPELLDISTAPQLDLFLSQLFFDLQGGGAIGALWSVSSEVQFYIAIPFLHAICALYMKTLMRALVITTVVIVLIAAVKVYAMTGWPMYWLRHVFYPMLANMDCFFAGYGAVVVVNFLKMRAFYLRSGMLAAVVVGVVYYVILSYASYICMALEHAPYRVVYLGLFPGITAMVTAIVIVLFEVSIRAFTNRKGITKKFWLLQSGLGMLTYSLYVWHEPVILSLRKVTKTSMNFVESIAYFPIGFLLCVSISYIFYKYVETRFDSMRTYGK